MSEETTNSVVADAFAQLIVSDVPGGLLALSIILNVVLLAPHIARYMKGVNHDRH